MLKDMLVGSQGQKADDLGFKWHVFVCYVFTYMHLVYMMMMVARICRGSRKDKVVRI